MQPARLAVSVVLYRPPLPMLQTTLQSLARALAFAKKQQSLQQAMLWLVNNDTTHNDELQTAIAQLSSPTLNVTLLQGHGNIGYGAGHNLAITQIQCSGVTWDYQLILNSDVLLAENALDEALRFMACHHEAGLLAPRVDTANGRLQRLCKRYPTVFDLMLRGFAPLPLRRRFDQRLARYELRDRINHTQRGAVWDIPIISGCFMLIRQPLLTRLGGFCPDYFLYFEDFDLSLRAAKHARTVYVPSVKIIHYGGQAARKGWRHIVFFIHSGIKFFNRHGWRWF